MLYIIHITQFSFNFFLCIETVGVEEDEGGAGQRLLDWLGGTQRQVSSGLIFHEYSVNLLEIECVSQLQMYTIARKISTYSFIITSKQNIVNI